MHMHIPMHTQMDYNTIQYKRNTNANQNANLSTIHTIRYNATRYTTIHIHIKYNASHTNTIPIQYNTIHTNNNTRGSSSRKDSLRDHPRTLMQGRSVGR